MQRARIAVERHPAQRGKARGIGPRHRERIAQRGSWARTPRAKTRSRSAQAPAHRRHRAAGTGQAELAGEIEFTLERGKGAFDRTREPAGLVLVSRCSVNGAREQRAVEPRGFRQTIRRGGGGGMPKPRRRLRQERQMGNWPRGGARSATRISQARREGRRQNGAALDHAGIAIPRCSRTRARSISATLMPRLARCSATEVPTMPAPSTMASARAMIGYLRVRPVAASFIWNAFYRPAIPRRSLAVHVHSYGVARRFGVARPAGPRARRVGLRRPRAAAVRGLCEASAKTVFAPLCRSLICGTAAFIRYVRLEVDHCRRAVGDGRGAVVLHRLYGGWPARGHAALDTILILQIVTTPITSSAAFAALMGLDVAFSLVTLDHHQLLHRYYRRLQLSISRLVAVLAIELAHQAVPCFAPSWYCLCHPPRRRLGMVGAAEGAARHGLNVVAVFIFAIAAMESAAMCKCDPVFAIELFVLGDPRAACSSA